MKLPDKDELDNAKIHKLLTDALLTNPIPENTQLQACIGALEFEFADQALLIRLPHPLFANYYYRTSQSELEKLVYSIFGPQIPIHYQDPSSCVTGNSLEPAREQVKIPDQFADFITGEKNRMAVAAARAITTTQAPAPLLIIYGPSGCGKSHLLDAIRKTLTDNWGRHSCFLTRGANFQTNYNPEKFWNRCRALLVDDVEQMTLAMQQELVNYLDCAHGGQQPGRVVITTDSCNFMHLSERLARRLECGLAVGLGQADLPMRLQYAEIKCKELGLPKQHALPLARHSQHIPGVLGLLQKLAFYSRITGQYLTADQIEKLALPNEQLSDWQILIQTIARHLQVKPAEILGQSRKKKLVLARQAAMYLCRFKLGLPYTEIGRLFGGRDHSTVIHGINKIQGLRQSDNFMHNLLTHLTNQDQ